MPRILDKDYAMGIGQDMMNIVEYSMPRILDGVGKLNIWITTTDILKKKIGVKSEIE